MSAKLSCEQCAFAVENSRPKDVQGVVDLSVPRSFQCRRFPPTFITNAQGWIPSWPNMLATHWCGEFESVTAAEAEANAQGLN